MKRSFLALLFLLLPSVASAQAHKVCPSGQAVVGSKGPPDDCASFAGSGTATPLSPYSFGASGSTATGICTTTVGNSLTDCTGISSFAVGQNIRILNAGNTAGLGTPAAPTITPICGGSGCSTAGAHTYVYSIASLDSAGNAAISPAGATATVSSIGVLGPPIVDKASNVVGTFIKNHITWSAVTNAPGYMVCRQVDGGANIPWGLTGATSYDDFGLAQLGQRFTPADYGWPATCPSVSIRNNVFAKITAISGGTITIAPQTIQPTTAVKGALPNTAYPSQPQTSITTTIEHDDTPAFRAMEVLARAASAQVPKTIHIPCGDFNVNLSSGENSPDFLTAMDLSSISNLTIEGDGNCAFIHAKGNQSDYVGFGDSVFLSSSDSAATPPRWSFDDAAHYPQYSLNDPINQSSNAITFSTAGNAANIPVGHDAWISITQANYPGVRISEKNKIVSLDATSGISTLERPTNKAYSASTYLGQCVNNGCAGPPVVADVTAGVSSRDVHIHDLSVQGPVRLSFTIQSVGFHMWNLHVPLVITSNDSVYDTDLQTCDHCYLGVDSLLDEGVGPVGTAGSDRVTFTNNVVVSTGGMASQACTEGTAHLNVSDNVYFISGYLPTNGAVVTLGNGCFSPIVHHNVFDISTTNMGLVVGGQFLVRDGIVDDNITVSDGLASTPAFYRSSDNPVEVTLSNNTSNIALPRGLDTTYIPPNNGPGLLDGYGIMNGGLTLNGGLAVLGLADPTAPVVAGLPVGATTCPLYFVVVHTNTGVTLPSAASSGSTCVATPSSTTWNTIVISPLAGAVSVDILKGDTATSLATAVSVTDISGLTPVGFTYRDTGQSTSAYVAPTSNTTAGAAISLDPLNTFQIGNNGTGGTTQQTALKIRSDSSVGQGPSTFRIWDTAFGTAGWSLEANSNPSENTSGTWSLFFDATGGNINTFYTPNGGAQVQPFKQTASGLMTSINGFQNKLAAEAQPRELLSATNGYLVGLGTLSPSVVINEKGVFSPTPFTFANLATTLTINGQSGFCSDCKNVVSDAVTAGAACVGSGTGAPAIRVNGVYQCN